MKTVTILLFSLMLALSGCVTYWKGEWAKAKTEPEKRAVFDRMASQSLVNLADIKYLDQHGDPICGDATHSGAEHWEGLLHGVVFTWSDGTKTRVDGISARAITFACTKAYGGGGGHWTFELFEEEYPCRKNRTQTPPPKEAPKEGTERAPASVVDSVIPESKPGGQSPNTKP